MLRKSGDPLIRLPRVSNGMKNNSGGRNILGSGIGLKQTVFADVADSEITVRDLAKRCGISIGSAARFKRLAATDEKRYLE